ncbi:hypothetical protein PMAYCL1PPCAC_32257 [Pristionchus mayeri]|uniref:Cytochrome P450 n=1 Tax=Pristionchus mayeri TaxID=1317129 RepID=A0AAN5DHC2_9BILA|nr:hypothetical protein PMAYCL1PPCAC_32257 [Pristionchus mayeri]
MIGEFALALFAAFYYLPWIFKGIRDYLYEAPYYKKLPGPKGLSFIGSAFEVAVGEDTTAPLKFWLKEADKAREQGHDIFTVTAMGRHIAFPLSGESVKFICESNEEILKGKDYEFLRPWVGSGLMLSIGKKWKDRRRALTHVFHFTMLEGYTMTFNKHARVFVDILSKQSGTVVDMEIHLKRLSLDSALNTTMGMDFGIQHNPKHPYLASVDIFTNYAQRYNNEPHMWINWIWYLVYSREYNDVLKKLNDFSIEVLAKRMESVRKGEVDLEAKYKPLIDIFIALCNKGECTYDEVHYELNASIFGAHDTTSSTLTWIFWCLATQPQHQQRIYDEMTEIFGDSDRDCTLEDLQEMDFTERFMKESMRVFPPIPTVGRELMSDFQMGKYLLPKGSEIFIAPHIIHHNPDVYPEPWKFDPDRFLPDNVIERNPYDFIPFSAGPRNCLGQKFAMHEMKIIMSHAVRNFVFTTEHDILDQECKVEVMCKPSLGCHLKVEKRK